MNADSTNYETLAVKKVPRQPKRKTPHKRQKPYLYLLILGIVSIIAVIGVASAISSSRKYQKKLDEITEAGIATPAYSPVVLEQMMNAAVETGQKNILDNIQTSFENGSSTNAFLKATFPNNIITYDDNHYVFLPILDSVPRHTLDVNKFQKDANGFMAYADNGITTHKGIDVSRYQGTIDWDKVKNSGVEFAFIRLGYRSYGTGVIKDDDAFAANASGALKTGMHVGVYFFSQAINTQEAIEEADYVLEAIKPYNIDYPIVIDVEEIPDDTYRQENMTREELTATVVAFCERIKAAGRTPIVYGNIKGLANNLDLTQLTAYEKWFADYNPTPYYPYEMSIWQYSDSGKIDGIEGNVDLNISFKELNR